MSLGDLQSQLLAWTILYGYPVLAVTLLISAVGPPLPASLIATLAGTLVADGDMNLPAAVLLAAAACIVGDLVGFGVGRLGGRGLAVRHGRWFGVTAARLLQAESLFRRWAGPTLLLSRSLLAIIAPAVNILAGFSGERLLRFLLYDTLGRLLWVGAYIGLGYVFAGSAQTAADFLSSISGALGALAVAAILAVLAARSPRTTRTS